MCAAFNPPAPGDDAQAMTVALIAVGVQLFGLACVIALARAASIGDK
jgi:hypothetical protein